MSKRDKYVEKMKLQLDEMNQQVTQLAERTKDVKDDAREAFEQQVARLRADSRAAGAHLDQVIAAGEDGWHKLVSEMERLRTAFTHSFAYFRSQL